MNREKNKLLTFLKVFYLIVYLAITIYLVWSFLDIVISPSQNVGLEVAVFLSLVVIILGSVGYLICISISITGFVISLVKKKGVGNLLFFTIATLLPILTEAIIIILCQVIV